MPFSAETGRMSFGMEIGLQGLDSITMTDSRDWITRP